MDAYSDIFDLAFDGFDNWQERLSDIAKDMAKNIFDLSVKNPFLNEQYGANLPTMNQTGGIGGFFATMLGMTPNPAINALGTQSVGAMTVNAASVVVTGSIGASGGTGILDRILSPANSNAVGSAAKTAASLIPGGGALASAAGQAISFVGNYKQGVDNRLTDILSEAAKRFGGYGVSAFSGVRPGDPRFHGQGLATDVRLTDLATGKALANYQDPSTFRSYEQFAQMARQVQMEKYPELADKFRWGGYFSGGRGKYGAMDQMHFDLGGGRVGMGGGSWANGLSASQRAMFPGVESLGMGANKAAQALDALTTKSTDLNSGFDLLGKGLMGQNGNGGLLSFLGSANFKPNTSLSAILGAPGGATQGGGGLLGGLFGWIGKLFGFADGTENAPEGWAWVGERGPELRKLRAGDVIRSNPRSMEMMNAARSGGPSKTEMHFHNAPPVLHQQEEDDGEGGKRMDIWFEQQTAKATSRRGSAANKALASMGLTRPMKVR